jgi:signal transduction histidine kinase
MIRTASFGLALLYAVLVATSAVILGLIVYWTVQASMDQQLAERIDAEIVTLKGELKEGPDELVKEVQERVTFFDTLEYALSDAGGKELAGNLPMPATLGWSDVTLPNNQAPNGSARLRVDTVILDNGFRLAVGDELGPKEDIRKAFLHTLGWTLLAFLILTLAGGVLLSSVFLRRVDIVVRTVEAIIEGDLNSRVPLRGTHDDFDRLSASLNRMLDRIKLLMESLSQVSNDIAHALRTPLGRLRQKLEDARTGSRNAESERLIDAALIETDNILETFSALLRIAQIESATRTAGFREFDLSELFETVSEAYSAAAEDQGKTLITDITPSLRCWGDTDLISEMLANLLDNAVRHTPSGSHIKVSLANQGSQFVGIVADDGPGVPEGERERILRRFYRLESSSNTPGIGLGLPLVAAVAELHCMRLTVEDNAPGLSIKIAFEPIFSDHWEHARPSIRKRWITEHGY